MSLDRKASVDEYLVTAGQIFDYCGAESKATLRVDALMDKFAPFVKTEKSEYSYLKSLLDPQHRNPEIDVPTLANALHQYSDSQKSKFDLDESFNLKGGPMPQDSDSGISSDGFHLVEELQCELREKARLASQLRGQLDLCDRHHEEALAALTAERDSLRAHLNMLRDENMTLTHVRRDYEEACDRLCSSEQALKAARDELDIGRKKNKLLEDRLSDLEIERLTLQELITESKDECHRINEMYATRQSALIEENETLRTEHADLSARLQDQEDFMQQIIKEKVHLEMELKELLNKSNQTQSRLDRSIDVSYSEEHHALSALDTLTADSRFTPENHLLDEESFINALKEDQGRPTNISLFDEIRLSFCHSKSQTDARDHCVKCMEVMNSSCTTVATQTDEGYIDETTCDCVDKSKECKDDEKNSTNMCKDSRCFSSSMTVATQTEKGYIEYNDDEKTCDSIDKSTKETAENSIEKKSTNVSNNSICFECEKLQRHVAKLRSDLTFSESIVKDLHSELERYETNLEKLQTFADEDNKRNSVLQSIVQSLESKLSILEMMSVQQMETFTAECQTESDIMSVSTQAEIPCSDCVKRKAVVPHSGLRKFLWDPLKCLFQVFAVVCFLCAVSVLYGVTRRWNARCGRDAGAGVPWRWLDAQEFMDLLLRIEYIAEVPM